jgi:hypothetical protein
MVEGLPRYGLLHLQSEFILVAIEEVSIGRGVWGSEGPLASGMITRVRSGLGAVFGGLRGR